MKKNHCRLAAALGFGLGVLAGALGVLVIRSRRKGHLSLTPRLAPSVIRGSEQGQSLYEPLTRSYIRIRDRRDEIADVPATEEEVRAFLSLRRGLQPRTQEIRQKWPTPGGLGAGVAFREALLHFRDSTSVYFYLVAPPTIGVQPEADLLYMTSSNTAGRGCEALLSFFNTEQYRCVFRIWDWAHPDQPNGGKFVRGFSYDQLSEYLIPYVFNLESGHELETVCVYVVNVTRRTNGNSFTNEVYLHNHASGTRDLMWSYAFDWPDKSSTGAFWWGPIFETFPNPGARYVLANPVGFDGALLVQDGAEYQMNDQNSTMTLPQNNGLVEVYRPAGSNSGLVCT